MILEQEHRTSDPIMDHWIMCGYSMNSTKGFYKGTHGNITKKKNQTHPKIME